jgi:hypothetical protein
MRSWGHLFPSRSNPLAHTLKTRSVIHGRLGLEVLEARTVPGSLGRAHCWWASLPRVSSPTTSRAASSVTPQFLADGREGHVPLDSHDDGSPGVRRRRPSVRPVRPDDFGGWSGIRSRNRIGHGRDFPPHITRCSGEELPARHGQFADQNRAEPPTEFGDSPPAELVAGSVGRSKGVLNEITGSALGADARGESGIGDCEQKVSGTFKDLGERVPNGCNRWHGRGRSRSEKSSCSSNEFARCG